jgi:hypothetical protein
MRQGRYETAASVYEAILASATGEVVRDAAEFNLSIVRRRLDAKVRDVLIGEDRIATPEPEPARPVAAIRAYRSLSRETLPPDAAQKYDDLRSHFDDHFYCQRYADIERADVDPLSHYVLIGWKEGRDPTPHFSTRYYLQSNPDVAGAGVEPFWHYVVAGRAEGRRPFSKLFEARTKLFELESLTTLRKTWINPSPEVALDFRGEAVQILIDVMNAARRVIVAIGHDHYLRQTGGIQACIGREATIANERGDLYLNLHPVQPLPTLSTAADSADYPMLAVVANGTDLGRARASHLHDLLSNIPTDRVYLVIHSILGHSPEYISSLADLCPEKHRFFWAHDYTALCSNFSLFRNVIEFCGAPSPRSNSCFACVHGSEREIHVRRIKDLLLTRSFSILCPSDYVAEFLTGKATYLRHLRRIIIPHYKATRKRRRATSGRRTVHPMTVAFLGTPAPHKGWETFLRIVERYGADSAIKFLHLGENSLGKESRIETVPVKVSPTSPDAMVDALKELSVHIVVIWPNWPETYSLVTMEALIAGAWVLTNSKSGNVARLVTEFGGGVVHSSEADLIAHFDLLVTEFHDRGTVPVGDAIQQSQLSHLTYEVIGD